MTNTVNHYRLVIRIILRFKRSDKSNTILLILLNADHYKQKMIKLIKKVTK